MGFTFNGSTSDSYGMVVKSIDRSALPPTRRRELVIPGRHGTYQFEDMKFDNRLITLSCFITATGLENLRSQIRNIAGWLKGSGELSFDDEPTKFYTARLFNQIPLEHVAHHGMIELVFEAQPFAHSTLQTTEVTRTDVTPISIVTTGTVETPAIYTITNNGGAVNRVEIEITQTKNGVPRTQSMVYTGSLASSDVLIFDTEKFTLKKNGVNALVQFEGIFTDLEPGSNSVVIKSNTATRTLLVKVQYKNRWV